jgi:hypothetical protein
MSDLVSVALLVNNLYEYLGRAGRLLKGVSMSSGKDQWADFLKFCDRCANSNWWFRGVTDTNYELVPKVGRGLEDKDWAGPVDDERSVTFLEYEHRIFNAFRRRARLGLQFLPESKFEWLALAQHHGVPTRLLDWTPNPLMAAWFATGAEHPKDGQVARIYAVRVRARETVEADEDRYDPLKSDVGSPVFVISPHFHTRVRAQRGCFSVHPQPNKPLSLGDFKHNTFDISKVHWREFRRRLFYFGVDASTVMPDLSGLGAALAWQYESRIGIGAVGY